MRVPLKATPNSGRRAPSPHTYAFAIRYIHTYLYITTNALPWLYEAGLTVASSSDNDAKFRPQSIIASPNSVSRYGIPCLSASALTLGTRECSLWRGNWDKIQGGVSLSLALSLYNTGGDPVLESERFDPWHEREQLVAR